ncbi:MAG: type I-E CRISPR-associated endoribonuclease Cas2 [Candidatus Sumerlaeia bacterium]|nr:type I-E CRISPR-associated endoribonuclease Cas2 [Candidatus Sumerlaeia bacterium]
MTLLILQRVSPSLRGELTRWLMEPQAGVFIGRVSALVRQKLWDKCTQRLKPGQGALLIYTAPAEQGFTVLSAGETRRQVIDAEGLWLVRRPRPGRRGSPEPAGEDPL